MRGRADCVTARLLQGAFAEAQALYLHPEQGAVCELASQLETAKMGVVAHFYMDPEARFVTNTAVPTIAHHHRVLVDGC